MLKQRTDQLTVGWLFLGLGIAIGFAAIRFGETYETKLYAVFFAGPLAVMGVMQLARAFLSTPVVEAEAAPKDVQLKGLRQVFPALMIVVPLVCALQAHDLWQLQSGAAKSASLWGPVGPVYRWFGVWPAMLTLPLLGGALLTWMFFRIRLLART